MTEAAERIKPEILQLAATDRAELAHLLLLSLEEASTEDVEAAWDEELNKRLRRIDAGESSGRPASEVLADIRAKYTR